MEKEIVEFCKKHDITEKQFSGKEKISGYLDLNSLTSIPAGFNPTVGGYLDLSSLTSIPAGFNPAVGGSLYLRSLTSIPAGFNPTVGGYLDLRSGLKAKTKKYTLNILTFNNGKYILVDGVFTEVLHRKGNIYKVKQINKSKEFYLVGNNEETFFAHGDTLKKAKEDLQFKIISETLKNAPIKKDTIIDIKYYRLITGACETGCKNFIENNDLKTSYRAVDLIKILDKSKPYGYEKFKALLTF